MVDRSVTKTKPIPLTWIFRYKIDEDGYLKSFKSRICVRGDLQPPSEKDTYTATLTSKSLRILLAVITRWDLEARQLDTVNAFPNAKLDEVVYIELPNRYKIQGKIALFFQALYGLRRSLLLWQQLFIETFTTLGLQPVPDKPCIMINDWLIVFFFIDDIIYAYKVIDELRIDDFRTKLMQRFEIRNLDETIWFLSIKITRNRPQCKLWINLESYFEKIAAKFYSDIYGALRAPMTLQYLEPYEGTATAAETHLF